jgi:hypothetical protein
MHHLHTALVSLTEISTFKVANKHKKLKNLTAKERSDFQASKGMKLKQKRKKVTPIIIIIIVIIIVIIIIVTVTKKLFSLYKVLL